jgi:hypothetical protein
VQVMLGARGRRGLLGARSPPEQLRDGQQHDAAGWSRTLSPSRAPVSGLGEHRVDEAAVGV